MSKKVDLGEVAELYAATYLRLAGYEVFKPTRDQSPYDLMVETPQGVSAKVEVKYTGNRKPGGAFQVELRSTGGNKSRQTSQPFSARADYLFVLTSTFRMFWISTKGLDGRRCINVGTEGSESKFDGFEIQTGDIALMVMNKLGLPTCSFHGDENGNIFVNGKRYMPVPEDMVC